jgi:FkbM family methyltransferase
MDLVTFLDALSAKRRNLGLPSSHLGMSIRNLIRRRGVCIRVDGLRIWGSEAHKCYFLDFVRQGTWEPYMCDLFRKSLRPGMNVLDIGANIGYYTLMSARAGARVHAFEPDARNLHYLFRNLHTNRLTGNVTIVKKAISDAVGTDYFYEHEGLLESSLYSSLATGTATSVECTTVDEYVGLDLHIDLIKMDIEGAELRALRGMERFISRSETHLEMFLECYPAGLEAAGASGELIVDWLRAHNFAVMAIDEKTRRLVPVDSIDLRTPSFGGELVRAFNLYCSRS